jgi:hypothetical protein
MRTIASIAVFLAAMALAVCCGAAGQYIYVKEVTMHLNGDNATFELNYSLEPFTRLYVLALGCKYLEPDLLSFLGNYSQVKLIKADLNGAALQVRGAGEYNDGYYLFDSRRFGSGNNPLREGIAKFSVVYPGGRVRTFYNVTSTEKVFCPATPLFNQSEGS